MKNPTISLNTNTKVDMGSSVITLYLNEEQKEKNSTVCCSIDVTILF